MTILKKIFTVIYIGGLSITLSGCALGMLLFYKDSYSSTLYRTADSKKNYFTITGITYSHCGCTHLTIDNYKNKKKEFSIYYNNGHIRKTLYSYNKQTKKFDTTVYNGTSSSIFKVPFDSTEILIFKTIDSFAVNPPKGTYPIKKNENKGYFLATDY